MRQFQRRVGRRGAQWQRRVPLSHFSTWTEAGATVKEGPTSGVISDFTDGEIAMIDSSGAVKAQPGALNGSGTSFSATWERSAYLQVRAPLPPSQMCRAGG